MATLSLASLSEEGWLPYDPFIEGRDDQSKRRNTPIDQVFQGLAVDAVSWSAEYIGRDQAIDLGFPFMVWVAPEKDSQRYPDGIHVYGVTLVEEDGGRAYYKEWKETTGIPYACELKLLELVEPPIDPVTGHGHGVAQDWRKSVEDYWQGWAEK